MTKKWITAVSCLFILTACNGQSTKGSGDVLAGVNGKKITAQEVDNAVASQMSRLSTQIYQIKKNGLEELIDDALLKEAAEKAKMPIEAYLDKGLAEKVQEPTEEEIKAFYEARKEQTGGKSFDEIKEAIKSFLLQNRKNAAKESLLASLRDQADLKIFLEPPRTEVSVGDAYTKGPKNAPVTIIEYSDYQCPFCGRARSTVNQVLSTYGDKIYYAFKDFPLSFHKQAPKAHEAAYCAGDQDKYWEYSTLLFSNQQALDMPNLKNYATELKLDLKKFEECVNSGKYSKRVQDNQAEGMRVGVSGTPAYFINGVEISGARPFSDFKTVIDDELSRKK